MTAHDLSVGAELPSRAFGPLTRTDFVRYQGASGDFNPMHHDEAFARSAGFDTVFSVGMLQAGLLATYCTDLLGAANVRRFKVQFREQVWPGDTLVASARVTQVYEAGEEPRVDLDITMARAGGGVAIKGTATFATDELGTDE
ncbi:MAG TPA: MaoC/PaaZ C-terminal domain-containing protein [Acidimicrobiales bacterium]|nr:MaoC/PaaZ C-terminal domain-containing protein [Acidimicrobiales bacterium]